MLTDSPEDGRKGCAMAEPKLVEGFQVVLQLEAKAPISDEQLEADMECAMPALLENAREVALGPVFGVNFESRSVEIEFSVVADTHEKLHGKINFVLDVLAEAGLALTGSTTSRLKPDEAREDDRELVPA